jgi:transcription elongation factor Elf1
MTDAALLSSECPHCGHERVQTGYARDELEQLLAAGAEIEAYCSNCDESWFISVEERADLARALARPSAKR